MKNISYCEPSDKKSGGQERHEGTTLRQVEQPLHRVVHRVHTCQRCGASLRDVKPFKIDDCKVLDLSPVTMEVTQHEREVKSCPHYRCVQQAEFPSHVTNHVQYICGSLRLSCICATYKLMIKIISPVIT